MQTALENSKRAMKEAADEIEKLKFQIEDAASALEKIDQNSENAMDTGSCRRRLALHNIIYSAAWFFAWVLWGNISTCTHCICRHTLTGASGA